MESIDIHKFGGSSLATPEQFRSVNEKLSKNKQVIVVSAVGNTTSMLEKCVQNAQEGSLFTDYLEQIKHTHVYLINDLFSPENQTELKAQLQIDINQIEELLGVLALFKMNQFEISEIVMGYGEQWSAKILAQVLNEIKPTSYICAYDFITVDDSNLKNILWQETSEKLNDILPKNNVVLTGFIASTKDNKHTTLGRNGSDYSASIVAHTLNAAHLTIWTDVDGILSANPKIVPSAFVLEHLSYNEALELAYFGASVIHPKTISPVIEKSIPVSIRNSFHPERKGTRINASSDSVNEIKGITSIRNLSLITVEGSGMIGVSGIAARVFQTTQSIGVSVVLITQSSSEHSICFVIQSNEVIHTLSALTEHFQVEIVKKTIQSIKNEDNCSIIAVVGDTMVGTLGILEKVSGSLAKASVNIKAVAQGSSERNISVIVSEKDLHKSIRAIHSGFHLSKKTLSIGLIGTGLIGTELLNQFNIEMKRLSNQFDVNLRVRGIMSSKKMVLSEESIDLSNWKHSLESSNRVCNMDTFAAHIKSDEIPHSLIIDCTASNDVAKEYLNFINRGIHIITPNKKAHSSEMSYYKELKQKIRVNNTHFLYETTVGAGLPIIRTLDDLIQTGDKVMKIEGVFSGTLAYLFDQFDGTKPFSSIVLEAKEKGFTEPDPRDDLSGMDVARKVVILARQMGLNVSLSDIDVESLVPKSLETCSLEEFMEKLPDFDSDMNAKIVEAKSQGASLRYIGFLDDKAEIGVKLMSFDSSHPFGRMQGSDNIVRFTTKRYLNQPLIVQGPGAGAEVTAAGIFSDVLRLLQSI